MVPPVAIIVPVLNEADNIEPFVEELSRSLTIYDWEVIFVDDKSNDGTQEAIGRLVAAKSNVRLLQRFGRHGRAPACIEGMCSTCAPLLAICHGAPADSSTIPVTLPFVFILQKATDPLWELRQIKPSARVASNHPKNGS